MRPLIAALLLVTAACSRASHELPAKAAETTFEGAEVTNAAALVAHGDRLTQVLGCKGCHTSALTGQNFLGDAPQYGALYASNLTQVLPTYSDAEVEQILRRGVHPTRKELWVMPSQAFQNLSPADMRALLAYLRTVHASGAPTPPPKFTPLGVKFIAAQHAKPVAQMVAEAKAKPLADLGPRYASGRYLASVTCAECHGSDLTGIANVEPGLNSPNLVVAGGYSRADFERLMTTGVPVGGRKLRLMDDVAKERFTRFTPHERDALYAYLKARAERP